MALYRNVSPNFWTDAKVDGYFTPEDKYFYLYLLTNPHTRLCGCYELSLKRMEWETGYNRDTVIRLMQRFEEVHKVLVFNRETQEVLLLNWPKYNWTKSEKFMIAVKKELAAIKCEEFREAIREAIASEDRVSIRYPYGMDTTVSVSVSDTVPVSVSNTESVSRNNINNNNINTLSTTNLNKGDPAPAEEIIEYLNMKTGSNYRAGTKKTRELIGARLREGFTVKDFKTVIDKKCAEWKGTEFEEHLVPVTLFGTKFEGYLNQKIRKPKDLEAQRRAFFADVMDG